MSDKAPEILRDEALAIIKREVTQRRRRRDPADVAKRFHAVDFQFIKLREPGGPANINTPLLTIVPEGTEFEAQLFAPSRAVGFLKPGQTVRLRYHAFPYQKFGSYNGSVISVARTAMSPAELPSQMSGLTNLVAAGEPAYRIVVKLERQSVAAYGKDAPLRAGMQLDADVQLDQRSILEWVFDPLFALTRR